MFITGHWAAAFINSLAAQDGDAEEGLGALKAFAPWIKSLPGNISGSSAAEKLEKLIREGIAKAGASSEFTNSEEAVNSARPINSNPSLETALRFLVLMARKNMIHHIDAVIDEIKKILDRKNGIIRASLEYAFPPDDEPRIKEAIIKRTGAARVDLEGRVNPELIGGYRLRVGDEIIDTSIRTHLRKLEACLAADTSGSAVGGN